MVLLLGLYCHMNESLWNLDDSHRTLLGYSGYKSKLENKEARANGSHFLGEKARKGKDGPNLCNVSIFGQTTAVM